MGTDPADTVRAGYNALSRRYRGDDDTPAEYNRWLAALRDRLPEHGHVLDIGCGCGIPVAQRLAADGHEVTGIDISDTQVERARKLVPGATFIRGDATELDFPPRSFTAVTCLYALIHMPLDRQPRLLSNIARWLRPGGWLLATTGQDAWTGTQDNWLGGEATMWWRHTDAATYRSWIFQAGLEITDQQFVPEGDSGHALFWGRRPDDDTDASGRLAEYANERRPGRPAHAKRYSAPVLRVAHLYGSLGRADLYALLAAVPAATGLAPVPYLLSHSVTASDMMRLVSMMFADTPRTTSKVLDAALTCDKSDVTTSSSRLEVSRRSGFPGIDARLTGPPRPAFAPKSEGTT